MKKFMKFTLVLLLAFSSGVQAQSEMTAQEIADSNRAAGLRLSEADEAKAAAEALAKSEAAAKEQATINQGADQGKQSQDKGAAMNMAAAAMLMAACMATKPPNMALCAMGALAAMQAGADKSAAKKSAATYAASKSDANTPEAVAGADNGASGFNNPTVDDGMNALANQGYKVNENGVTFPDGSFKPASAFSSAASMEAAGIDPKAAGEAAAVLAKVNAQGEDPNAVRMVSMAVDGGAGGGSSPRNAGSEDSVLFNYKNPWAISAAARRKMTEGKSLNFAGEPIGVKGDNLFDMVHRAYEKKRNSANFIDGEGAVAAAARLPASVGVPSRLNTGK